MFVGLGLAAYGMALVATMPARIFVPRSGGTVWHGEAALAGGNLLEWRWQPLRSLTGLGFAAGFTIDGPETALTGGAVAGVSSLLLETVRGTADASLLGAMDLPFACALPLAVQIERLAIGGRPGFDGSVRSGAGSCVRKDEVSGLATAVPPLVARAVGDGRIAIVPRARTAQRLIEIGLDADGTIAVAVTPAGAAMLPFASPPGGMEVATKL